MIHDIDWLKARRTRPGLRRTWPGLKGVIMVESKRETGSRIERQTRFLHRIIRVEGADTRPMIRDHWSTENSLHWVMDMVFRDDECRVRTNNAPANFTGPRHVAHNLVRKAAPQAA